MTPSEHHADLGTFREKVRQWCAAHVPSDWRQQQLGADQKKLVEFQRWWAAQLAEVGWLAPHWPKPWGPGYSVAEQVVLAEELARGDAPRNGLFQVALYNAAPAIIHSGTDEQRDRFLPGILSGEVWCQGFSEPGAGSDLAALQTRAELHGDHYVVTGQKVWTSMATEADFCILLARTDPEAPKHRGITCLVADMHAAGVQVRPIKQATGASEFCETFFDGVLVPATNRIGPENEGWRVAQGTLASERAVVIVEMSERLRRNGVEEAIRQAAGWSLDIQPLEDQPDAESHVALGQVVDTLSGLYAEAMVLRAMLNAMISDVIAGRDVGGTAAIVKVFYSELLQATMQHVTDLAGPEAQVERPLLIAAGWETGNWMMDLVNSFGWTIGGGTNEIMRNVVAEKVLGLPR